MKKHVLYVDTKHVSLKLSHLYLYHIKYQSHNIDENLTFENVVPQTRNKFSTRNCFLRYN